MKVKVGVNEQLSIPIHLQLKEQLKSLIHQEIYKPGEQMPSVRELAGFLRINRNTTQKAYNELEHEGYVISRAGKGIFVDSTLDLKVDQNRERLLQQTLIELEQYNIDPQEFAFALLARHQIRLATKENTPTILFVECTVSQSKELAKELALATGFIVTPCLLSEFSQQEKMFQNDTYDCIVTTFLHIEEVENLLHTMKIEQTPKVIACLLQSNIMAIQHLQSIPKGSKVGIACATWEGTKNIRTSIEQSGYNHLELIEGAGESPATLPALLQGTRLVLCSSFVAPLIEQFSPDIPVVIDDQYINQQSIELIKKIVNKQ